MPGMFDFAGKRRFFESCSGGIPILLFAETGAYIAPRVAGKAGACRAVGVGRTLCGRLTGQCGEMGARRMADGFWPGLRCKRRFWSFQSVIVAGTVSTC